MSRQSLLHLTLLAREYHTRPSALADVTDAYLAYCLDAACFTVQAHAVRGLVSPAPRRATKLIGGVPVGQFDRE